MATRRFGPTLDAGTVIIEKEADKQIQPALLGSTAYTGVLERGPVGEVITATSKKDLLLKTGSLIPDSLLPDCCQDFWDHSEGAGILFLYRVTDGTEVKATLDLYDRKNPRNKVVTVDAKNSQEARNKTEEMCKRLLANPTKDNYEIIIEEQK